MAGQPYGELDTLSHSVAHGHNAHKRKDTVNATVSTKTSKGLDDDMNEHNVLGEEDSSDEDEDDESDDLALDADRAGTWAQEESDDEQAVAGADDASSIDEEDYSGLGAVEDDSQSLVDGGEEDLLKEAEKDLQQEFEEREDYIRRKKALDVEATWVTDNLVKADSQDRMSSAESDEEDPLGLDASYNWNDDPFNGADLFDPQHQILADHADLDFWTIANSIDMPQEPEAQADARPKRVRFQDISELSGSGNGESSDSSEEEADGDDEHFPDIFMAQDDPKIQQLLAHDTQDGMLSGPASDTGSVYDFEDDADRFAFELEEDTGSSAYDTDSDPDDDSDDDINYETEDDDELVAPRTELPKAVKSEASEASTSKVATPVRQNSGKHSVPLPRRPQSATESGKTSKGPRMGTFSCDPTKATVVSDANGKTTVLYMPTKPSEKHKAFWDHARSVAHSRDSSPRGSMIFPAGSAGDRTPQRPLTAESTLATMFNGNMDFMRCDDPTVPSASDLLAITQPILPSAFSASFGASTVAPTEDGSEMDEDLDTTFNMLVDMESDSDEEDADITPDITSPDQPLFLAQGVVGSFRLNQHRAKHESSLALHPASRASTSENNALQSGRRGAGNAPITPARKKRISKDMTFSSSGVKKPTSSSMSSPLSARKRNSRGKSISGRLDQTLAPGFSMWK